MPERAKKIVHVHPTHGYGRESGGAETVVSQLAEFQAVQGDEVRVYARLLTPPLDLSHQQAAETGVPNVSVIETPAASVEWAVRRRKLGASEGSISAELAGYFEKELRAFGDVSIVHAHNLQHPIVHPLARGLAIAAHRVGAKTVHTQHTLGDFHPAIVADYDRLVYPTQLAQQTTQALLPNAAGTIVPLGVDLTTFNRGGPIDAEIAEQRGVKFLVPARSADPGKGVRDAIEAFRRMLQVHPKIEATMILCDVLEVEEVVASHQHIAELKALTEGLPVLWTKISHRRMPDAMRASDVAVIPSRYREVGPLVAMEAAASGLPMIMTTPKFNLAPNSSGQITIHKTMGGLNLIPVNADPSVPDPDAVVGMARLMTEFGLGMDLRPSLGIRGRHAAERRWDVRRMLHGYQQVYSGLVLKGRRGAGPRASALG
jgi:glycosyltransferase involved in cell wall biosynthesis